MRTYRNIVLLWLGTLAVVGLFFLLFPHYEVRLASFGYNAILSLLFFLSAHIFIREPNHNYKFIFLNFTLFFSLSFFFQITYFVGRAFLSDFRYASHYFQVFTLLAYIFFYSLAIVYVVMDMLFRDFKVYQKYLCALGVVLFFYLVYFHPFFGDPHHLYGTEDVRQYKLVYENYSLFAEKFGRAPTTEELASFMVLPTWKDGIAVGELYHDQKVARIQGLLPYLEGDNYRVFLWKPMYLNMIYMNVMMMAFILLFFGYQYKKDPPQGAYVDKIMYSFFVFLSLDVLHNWSMIKSVEWRSWSDIFAVGQYISLGVLLAITFFFSLRLRFITSVQGEFYESELAANPQLISRWRDGIDNFVIRHFFGTKLIHGRLFEKRT
jgi:hypothetical protein